MPFYRKDPPGVVQESDSSPQPPAPGRPDGLLLPRVAEDHPLLDDSGVSRAFLARLAGCDRPQLLAALSPSCGSCLVLAAHLPDFQSQLGERVRIRPLVLATRQESAEVFPDLVDPWFAPDLEARDWIKTFAFPGTPGMALVDTEGVIRADFFSDFSSAAAILRALA
jgi:hypothetical protein